jgi:hypothetical protein
MSYSRIVVFAVAFALAAGAFAAKPKAKAKVNNYPTLDRVQYVLECAQNYPDKVHQEMIYKCSCAIDEIAKQISYDDFLNAWTSSKAVTIAGDRGAIREHQMVKGMVKQYKDVQGNAQKICLFN